MRKPVGADDQILPPWLMERSAHSFDPEIAAAFWETNQPAFPFARAFWVETNYGDFELCQQGSVPRIRPERSEQWPWAEFLARAAPLSWGLCAGFSASEHDVAIEAARRKEGVELGDSRVRVGITRGHCLSIVVNFRARQEVVQVQRAVEHYLEHLMGDRFMDDWVLDVSVERALLGRGVLTVYDGRRADTFPLVEAKSLLLRGAAVISEATKAWSQEDWVALDVPQLVEKSADVIQAERAHVSTCVPEALKWALEGAPFASERFVPRPLCLLWLEWRAEKPERNRTKQRVEAALHALLDGTEGAAVVGSGFGTELDYLDFVMPLDASRYDALLRWTAEQRERVRVGFYDTALRWLGDASGARSSTSERTSAS